ncbi:MAG: hydrogenase maturation protease [Gammaproteobacteria bacterium]|nr:hydrogenase maturation protease [Gammaproteobacteria bacterium]
MTADNTPNNTTNKTININVPVLARVEGEGALDLRIEDGKITDLKLRIFEPPRFFEKFLEGRSYREVLDTVARICGICPVAYQMTAVQALEAIFHTPVTPWTEAMRRVMYCGEWLQSHSLHVHMLAAPDFLGVNSIIEMARDNDEAVRRGLRLQALGNDLIALFGARSVHPVGACVGGFTRAPQPEEVRAMLQRLATAKPDAEAVLRWVAALDLPHDEQDFISVSLRQPQTYPITGGRIVSDQGLDIGIEAFEQYFSEHHIPHSTALHCLLQGQPYLLGPLARLNLNLDRLPTETRALLDDIGIVFPSRNMFHSIIARAVEMHAAVCDAHSLLEAYHYPTHSRVEVQASAGTGFGCTEAPRGLLWHRYELQSDGRITAARIVPPTSQNQARIEQDLAQSLRNLGLDKAPDVLRLHAEKVIRNYDPCISCATHFLTLSVHDTTAQTETNSDTATASLRNASLQTGHDQQPSILVIGIGSPNGSDTLGWEIVERLQQDKTLRQQAGLSFLSLDRPGTSLIEAMQHTDRVILIDAMATGQPPGRLVKLKIGDITANAQAIARNHHHSSHNLGLAETLALADTLQQLPPQLLILGLETRGDTDRQYSSEAREQLLQAIRAELLAVR